MNGTSERDQKDLLACGVSSFGSLPKQDFLTKSIYAKKKENIDCHVRVGGAVGTDLVVNNCPAGSVKDECKAGSVLMHVTPGASGYFENVWLWVADQ